VNSLGYRIQTHSPLGKFNVEKAKKLGIKEGKLWGKLQKGFKIKINDKTFKPSDVLEPSKEKKIKIVITGDTHLNQNVINYASNADLLIHDATYPPGEEARAEKYKHTTCTQAATIAKIANAKRLILTHISTLHKDGKESIEKVKEIFDNAEFAYDGLKIVLKNK